MLHLPGEGVVGRGVVGASVVGSAGLRNGKYKGNFLGSTSWSGLGSMADCPTFFGIRGSSLLGSFVGIESAESATYKTFKNREFDSRNHVKCKLSLLHMRVVMCVVNESDKRNNSELKVSV